jgi:hypothetical protein
VTLASFPFVISVKSCVSGEMTFVVHWGPLRMLLIAANPLVAPSRSAVGR